MTTLKFAVSLILDGGGKAYGKYPGRLLDISLPCTTATGKCEFYGTLSGRELPVSLVISLHAVDGIVLAADTRGTIGDPRGLTAISDVYKKIYRLSSHCGIGVAGASELGSSLLDRLEDKLAGEGHKYIDDVLASVRNHFRGQFNDWFPQIPITDRPNVLFLVAGYRQIGGRGKKKSLEPMTYMLRSGQDFAPELHQRGQGMVGVPQYAVYLANRYFDPSMNIENAAALVEFLIYETATQDPKVGGAINIAEITPKKGYRELSEDEVSALRTANDQQSQELREFFFRRR